MAGADVQLDRDSVLREWSQAAGAWRKWRSEFGIQSRAATDLIVKAALPEPGMRVLDLASGSGEPAISLARAAGPQGTVVATDLVPGMLLGAHQHAVELDYRNVICAAANAEALPFRSGAFDRVTCRFGVMFFPDLQLALAEVRRVLKPGRRAVFMAWGEAPRNNFFASTTGVLLRFVKSPPQGPDLAHRFAEPGSLSVALRRAAFLEVTETFHSIAWPWPGPPEGFWNYSVDVRRSFRRIFETLPPEEQQRARQESIREMGRHYDGRQVNFSAYVVIVSAARD
jgi:ubiquinone/menaquinone biosynthesis C-methylase UbiE